MNANNHELIHKVWMIGWWWYSSKGEGCTGPR